MKLGHEPEPVDYQAIQIDDLYHQVTTLNELVLKLLARIEHLEQQDPKSRRC